MGLRAYVETGDTGRRVGAKEGVWGTGEGLINVVSLFRLVGHKFQEKRGGEGARDRETKR